MQFNKVIFTSLGLILLLIPIIFANDDVIEDENDSDKRIVNGTRSAPGSHPYIVVLQEMIDGEYLQFCGGSIIDKQWIITAAHCFDQMPGLHIKLMVRIKAGAYTANTPDPNEIIRTIKEVYIHPLYDEDDYEAHYDIALVKLNEPLEYKANIQPVKLPDGKVDLSDVEGYVAGWGAITPDGSIASNDLLHGKMRLGTKKKCTRYGKEHESRLCLIGYHSTSCVGDSGGPFVITVNGAEILAGIVSIGSAVCNVNSAFIVTNVQHYLDFINEVKNNIIK